MKIGLTPIRELVLFYPEGKEAFTLGELKAITREMEKMFEQKGKRGN